jgi:N-acetylglucosamine-6-phosphate deacetylase
MDNGPILLRNLKIITPHEEIGHGFIILWGDKIFSVGEGSGYRNFWLTYRNEIDLEGLVAIPGLIDIHTHGGGGIDVTSNPEGIGKLSKHKAKGGVSHYLPTLWSQLPFEDLLKSLEKISEYIVRGKKRTGSIPLGVNMEAPFLHPGIGAHPGKFDINPEKEKVERILECGKGTVKIVNIAPELRGALEAISLLTRRGVISSLGHSMASPEQIEPAIERGANLATHLLNGTYPLSAREPGVVPVGLNEYLMIRDEVYAEVIVDHDGAHVHPVMLNILYRCKGIDRLILVTDSMFTAGLGEGDYDLADGRGIHCDGWVNRLDDGHLTGSAMELNRSVKSFMGQTSVGFGDAIKTVTVNPARLLGIERETGTIETGKKASLAVVNEDMDVYLTIVEGNIVYSSGIKL